MNKDLEQAHQVYEMAPPVEEQSAYDYLPAWLEPYIPGLQQDAADPVVWVKWFTPDSGWTWYVTNCDKEGYCFGYVEGLDNEWGYFTVPEIAAVRGPFGLRIERDLWWRPRLANEVVRERTCL